MDAVEATGRGADGFLARWSRRKAASRENTPQALMPGPLPQPDQPIAEAPEIELPPIETLGADSDYTMFLARGVCRTVQAQALRVAWASDPVIANFRGMAEYAWDFNAPGYGDLALNDDVAALLSQIIRSSPRLVAAEIIGADPLAVSVAASAGPAVPTAAGFPAQVAPPESVQSIAEPAAAALPAPLSPPPLSPAPVAELPVPRRRHGGAMPV